MSGVVGIASSNGIIVEGTGVDTPLQFTIGRSGGSDGAARVDWGVGSEIGIQPDDFVGGVFPSGTVSWADGETGSKTISFSIAGDSIPELDDMFVIGLFNPVGVTVRPEFQILRVRIPNDDFETQILGFTGDVSQAEGQSGETLYTFTVSRTGGLTGVVDFHVALDQQTTNDADYAVRFVSGLIYRLLDGQASTTVTVSVRGDLNVEPTESFGLTLSAAFSPNNGVTVQLGQGSAQGVIQNDDFGSGSFSISAVTTAVAEGNSGTTAITFNVTRSGGDNSSSTVDFGLVVGSDASSASPSDFAGPTSGTLTFDGN